MDAKYIIGTLVFQAKMARITMRSWKDLGKHMVYLQKGVADGFMMSARVVKGFSTQARTVNRMKKSRSEQCIAQ